MHYICRICCIEVCTYAREFRFGRGLIWRGLQDPLVVRVSFERFHKTPGGVIWGGSQNPPWRSIFGDVLCEPPAFFRERFILAVFCKPPGVVSARAFRGSSRDIQTYYCCRNLSWHPSLRCMKWYFSTTIMTVGSQWFLGQRKVKYLRQSKTLPREGLTVETFSDGSFIFETLPVKRLFPPRG